VFALFAIVAFSALGFAAQNTVEDSLAGDGAGDISGFDITGVHYTLDATNPRLLDAVEFDISPAVPAGGTVAVALDGTWLGACVVTGGTAVSCDADDAPVRPASNLRVVAAQ